MFRAAEVRVRFECPTHKLEYEIRVSKKNEGAGGEADSDGSSDGGNSPPAPLRPQPIRVRLEKKSFEEPVPAEVRPESPFSDLDNWRTQNPQYPTASLGTGGFESRESRRSSEETVIRHDVLESDNRFRVRPPSLVDETTRNPPWRTPESKYPEVFMDEADRSGNPIRDRTTPGMDEVENSLGGSTNGKFANAEWPAEHTNTQSFSFEDW